MRKFIITADTFDGEGVLLFYDNILKVIDLSRTNMNDVYSKWIYRNLPVALPDFIAFIESRKGGVLVREESCEIAFETFWNDYDKKINRKRCEVLWNRLSKNKQIQAWAGISKYNKFLKREHWRAKADPETYIKKEMWENDWK